MPTDIPTGLVIWVISVGGISLLFHLMDPKVSTRFELTVILLVMFGGTLRFINKYDPTLVLGYNVGSFATWWAGVMTAKCWRFVARWKRAAGP